MRARKLAVALFGALILIPGATVLPASAAFAAPQLPISPVQGPFDFDGKDPQSPEGDKQQQKQEKQGEKAEKLGGGVANKMIDLVTGIVKCTLNIATDSVPCKL